jgi:hypothetical protein
MPKQRFYEMFHIAASDYKIESEHNEYNFQVHYFGEISGSHGAKYQDVF